MMVTRLLFLAFLTQVSCEKRSLTFVIDDTFSLVDHIKQVKSASKLIMDTISETCDIEDYVLVTYNDPDTVLKKKTRNPKEFIHAIDSIKVHDGNKDTCPEITLSGTKRALNESSDGSYLFVVTDASARDYDKFEEVKALCQKKKSQIYFIMSGHCGDMSTQRYQVYHKLAAACQGQAITIHRDDITQVPAYFKKIMKGDRVVLESVVIPPYKWKYFEFSIDDLTENTIISASGIDIDLEIVRTKQSPVKIAWTRNFKAIEPSTLRRGLYTVKVRGKSPVDVMITAQTNFTFEYGFSVENVTSLNETDPQPFTDIKMHLMIFAKDLEGSADVKRVELHYAETKKVSKLLTRVKENVYVTEMFLSPEQPFKIVVVATAKKTGKTVKSFAKTPVVPILPGSVEQLNVKEGGSIDIHCRIASTNESRVTWYIKKPNEKDFSVLSGQTAEVLHVDKPVAKVYYKCLARNEAGYDQYNGQLDVVVRPEIIYPPRVIMTNIGDTVTIECKIFKGNPPPEITWQFIHVNATSYEPMEQQGDTLTISSAQLEHSGEYRCLASNLEGRDDKTTKLVVQVAPEVLKTDDSFTTIEEGGSIDVKCSILKGIPKPVITWYAKQQGESDFDEIVEERNETLHVTNATASKSYKCEANNSAGGDFNIVNIYVEAAPEFKDTTTNITVTEGDPVTIDCKLRKGNPPLEQSWEKMLKSEASFKVMRHEGEELKILAAELSHAGEYRCVVENAKGHAEKVTELIVRGK